MIVITGAAGFIGSVVAGFLNNLGHDNLVLVDDFTRREKKPNYFNKKYQELVERNAFSSWLAKNAEQVDYVIHMGARTDTTEFDKAVFEALNLSYSKMVWELCSQFQIPLIYASSAATYGGGEHGYADSHGVVNQLAPLNPYGISKNEFDKWALQQFHTPPLWVGLKFFNVYGPNEYHKGRMASVMFHAFRQIREHGQVKLFRSHHPDYDDGKQLRDFIYVKDVAEVIHFLMNSQAPSGLYNLGTGQSRSFIDLATATFSALSLKSEITFVDTPIDIRDKYQYFTEAVMGKLIHAGYKRPFTSLEDGVADYVNNYLDGNRYF
jgi:ADP-L-glycero-D-manno-heptose 6-epimerase